MCFSHLPWFLPLQIGRDLEAVSCPFVALTILTPAEGASSFLGASAGVGTVFFTDSAPIGFFSDAFFAGAAGVVSAEAFFESFLAG